MANVFATLLNKAAKEGITSTRTETAKEWFRKEAASVRRANPAAIIQESPTTSSNSAIGKMFLFGYLPKHAKTLPYYDRFPLVFPFTNTPDGFYGINMHYLPLPLRAALMDGLYDYVIESKQDKNVRIKMTYQTLSNASKLRLFKPCVKHYLNSQVQTDMAQVPASLWDIALFLPLERFAKASKTRVHADSRMALIQR
jgi:hypothetical protein